MATFDENDNVPDDVNIIEPEFTVILIVTVFAGLELSFTTIEVEPAATPCTVTVAPEMVAVAIEEDGEDWME